MKISIENIRVFKGKHDVTIKPLTIVTGENSSGKSTLLAAIAAIYNPGSYPLRPDFNIPPFNLGSYDTIATQGTAKTIGLGLGDYLPKHSPAAERELDAVAAYVNESGQPALSELCVTNTRVRLEMQFKSLHNSKRRVSYKLIDGVSNYVDFEDEFELSRKASHNIAYFDDVFFDGIYRSLYMRRNKPSNEDKMQEYQDFVFSMLNSFPPRAALSIAPVRSKPRRTYDSIPVDYQPEGDHVPYTLARIWNESDTYEKSTVIKALAVFGKSSGMFESVRPKAYGENAGDPFQIQVVVAGRTSNLIDVGYGISQSLPIIVQTILSRENNIILLQQPEVHLHPRAQAALGTFFVETVAHRKQVMMIVETHSDYIVDRIRQEIAKGTIGNSDVQLLFIEKESEVSVIHQIDIDPNGNIVNPPPCYRDFFLHEEMNLLTRTTPK